MILNGCRFLSDLQQVTVDWLSVERGVDINLPVGVVHCLDLEHVLHVAGDQCEIDLKTQNCQLISYRTTGEAHFVTDDEPKSQLQHTMREVKYCTCSFKKKKKKRLKKVIYYFTLAIMVSKLEILH